MRKIIVNGVWFDPLAIYVGDEVYYSVLLCLAFLCFSGIYYAVEGPLEEASSWILGILFGLLFLAAANNQGFLWRLRWKPGEPDSNKFIAYFMYADRVLAFGILVLLLFHHEEAGWLQVAIFVMALLFYASTFAAYQDPPLLHGALFWPLQDPGLWFAFCTNFWHLSLALIFWSLL